MKRNAALTIPIIAANLFLASCNIQTTEKPPVVATPTQSQPPVRIFPRINGSVFGKQLHNAINKQRRTHNLPTLRWDDALMRIAVKHSRDMVSRQYFSHTSPEGYGFTQRYFKNNYACGITVENILYTGGENISRHSLFSFPYRATGQTSGELLADSNVFDTIIQDWLIIHEDRANILSPHWQREGIGIYIGPDDMIYITINYC